jgi:hypothetical protein
MPDAPDDPADRVARLRARMAEQTRKAERLLAETPAADPAALLKAATDRIEAALPPGTPLPRDLLAVRHLEEVDRLSREGMSVRAIARTVGLSYSHTSLLRSRLGVARPRRRLR